MPRMSRRLPPVAAVIGFVDCINRGDLEGPDEEEERLRVIWVAMAENGKLSSWAVLDDSSETRTTLGLHGTP
jgi:hypothetical protein